MTPIKKVDSYVFELVDSPKYQYLKTALIAISGISLLCLDKNRASFSFKTNKLASFTSISSLIFLGSVSNLKKSINDLKNQQGEGFYKLATIALKHHHEDKWLEYLKTSADKGCLEARQEIGRYYYNTGLILLARKYLNPEINRLLIQTINNELSSVPKWERLPLDTFIKIGEIEETSIPSDPDQIQTACIVNMTDLRFLGSFKNLKNLIFCFNNDIKQKPISLNFSVFSFFNEIESLEICNQTSSPCSISGLEDCGSLQDVKLIGPTIIKNNFKWSRLFSLKSLTLIEKKAPLIDWTIMPKSLENLIIDTDTIEKDVDLSHLPNLQSLSIHKTRLKGQIVGTCSSLKSLTIIKSTINNLNLQCFQNLTSLFLDSIQIVSNEKINPSDLYVCQKLERLHLDNVALSAFLFVSIFKNLQSIRLVSSQSKTTYELKGLSSDSLIKFYGQNIILKEQLNLNSFPKLEMINLSFIGSFEFPSVNINSSKPHPLVDLHLYNAFLMSSLDFSYFENLKQIQIASSLSLSLEFKGLEKCLNISLLHLKGLEISNPLNLKNLRKIERLYIDTCYFESKPIEALGDCVSLNELKIENSQNIHRNLSPFYEELKRLPSGLKHLSLKNNGLSYTPELPVGDLKKLVMLDLSQNFIHAIPRELTQLSRDCELDLRKNPLRADNITAFLDHLILTNLHNPLLGTAISYSMPQAGFQEPSLQSVLSCWLEEIKQSKASLNKGINISEDALDALKQTIITNTNDDERDSLKTFLSRITLIGDYQNPIGRQGVRERVYNLLEGLVIDEDFKSKALEIIKDNLANCEDRITLAFDELEILATLTIPGENVSLENKASFIIGIHRRNLLKSIVIQKCAQRPNIKDTVEVYLYLQLKFSQLLQLPTLTKTALYAGKIFSDEVEKEITSTILNQTSSLKDKSNILLSFTLWCNTLQNRYASQFRAIDDKYDVDMGEDEASTQLKQIGHKKESKKLLKELTEEVLQKSSSSSS
ncbi:MAG: NEL-type E3 ubiquitin ligase domain-containing protein [Rhabdochlamydiaceae bacterium]